MLLLQDRVHTQRVIFLALLNSSATANAQVNNLPSIIPLLRKADECTECENLPSHSTTLDNQLHPTSSKHCVITSCLLGSQQMLCNDFTHSITLHSRQVTRCPRLYPCLCCATPAAARAVARRHTTAVCISSQVRLSHLRQGTTQVKPLPQNMQSIQLTSPSMQNILIHGNRREIMWFFCCLLLVFI